MPALFETQALCLRLEVGELAARHFMQIDFRGGCREPAFECRILLAHLLPVVGHFTHRLDVDAGIALGMAQRLDDRTETGLRRTAGKRIHRRVDTVDAGCTCRQNGGTRNAAGVMGVEVDRQAGLLLQCPDQVIGSRRLQEPRHVLEAENVGPRSLQLAGHLHIVVEIVFRPRRIENVAGIADRRLADLAGLQHRIDGNAHVLDPVERIEDAEDIDPGPGRLIDELDHHIVGIVGVADAVGGAQQHLRQQVGHALAQIAQPLPGAFLQKAVGNVEGRPAPAFHREKLRQVVGVGRRRIDHVDGTHARCQQRLVPVAHGCVGHQKLLLRQHPVGNRLRTLFLQQVAHPVRRSILSQFRCTRHFQRTFLAAFMPHRGQWLALRLGMPVDGDIGDIGEDLRRPVAPFPELEEFGRRVDELRRIGIVEKGRMLEQVLDKGDVG